MAKCGEIEKARWWIVIIFGVTLWGSQPRYGAVYVLGVDVITEEVEDIDVDFNLCINMFDFDCEKMIDFFSRDELVIGALEPDAGVAWLKHERQVMKQIVNRV